MKAYLTFITTFTAFWLYLLYYFVSMASPLLK